MNSDDGVRQRRIDVAWRLGVVASFSLAVARDQLVSVAGVETVLSILQFGIPTVILFAMLLQCRRRPASLRRSDKAVALLVVGFAVLLIVTSPFSASPSQSLVQSLIFAVMAAFVLVTYLLRWTKDSVVARDLLTVYLAVAVAQLLGLVAFLLGAEWATGYYGRLVGVFSNANYAGMISAFTLPLVVYLYATTAGRLRIVVLLATAPIALGLLTSQSRGALLAAIVGLVLATMLQVRRRRFSITAIAAGAVLGVAILVVYTIARSGSTAGLPQSSTDISSGRFDLIGLLLGRWLESPIIGQGYRSTAELTDGIEAHNLLLSILVENGVIGAVLAIGLVVSLVVASRGLSAAATAGAGVAVLVSELTESSFFGWGAPSTLVAWIVLFASARMSGTHNGSPRWSRTLDVSPPENEAQPRGVGRATDSI
jgi:O-antigen ligase